MQLGLAGFVFKKLHKQNAVSALSFTSNENLFYNQRL